MVQLSMPEVELARPRELDARGAEERDVCSRFETWEEWDASMPLWRHAVAGSCAGVAEHLGMYPLDTIKTHMQALRPGGSPVTLSEIVRGIIREHGGLGFMRGSSAIASGCIPAHVALFTSYEYAKEKLLTDSDSHEFARSALCGATSTLCHDLILTPMDVVKQRMQLGCYKSVGDCIRTVVRHEGLGSLYRSMPTTMAMNVPFGSVLVAANESIKMSLGIRKTRPDQAYAALPWYFLSAGASAALASCVTQPLDVIKTRLQTQDLLLSPLASRSSGLSGGSCERRAPKYAGFLPAVTTIMREEGLGALYHGTLPRMLHAVPSAALCWGTYEAVKTFLGS